MKLTTDDRKALQCAINVLAEILQQASPEVPERVEEWPEDDTHLQGEFWEDKDGDLWAYRNGLWRVWSPEKRTWDALPGVSLAVFSPFTRTTDPSIPRTWDTLDAVDADVERATGDYTGRRRLGSLPRPPGRCMMTEQTYTREDMARAWENGHSWGWDDARTKARAERDADIIGPRMTWRLLTPNPYEQEKK